MGLKHPAEALTDRIEQGNTDAVTTLGRSRDKGELKYAIAAATGAFDMTEEDVDESDGSFTKPELVALAEALSEASAGGD